MPPRCPLIEKPKHSITVLATLTLQPLQSIFIQSDMYYNLSQIVLKVTARVYNNCLHLVLLIIRIFSLITLKNDNFIKISLMEPILI